MPLVPQQDSGFRRAGMLLGLGGEVAAMLGVSAWLGYEADAYYQTAPWLMLLMLFLASGGVFMLVWRLGRRLSGN